MRPISSRQIEVNQHSGNPEESIGTFPRYDPPMAALPQFDYIFAIATLFAFLDAWNIGKLLSLSVTSSYSAAHDFTIILPLSIQRAVHPTFSDSIQVPTMLPTPSRLRSLPAHSRSSKPCVSPP